MNILNIFKRNNVAEKRSIIKTSGGVVGSLSFGSSANYTNKDSLTIGAFSRGINLISNSIASMPINVYKYNNNWKSIDYANPIYKLLNYSPNPYQNAFQFKKQILFNALYHGDSFTEIIRNVDEPVKLINHDPTLIEMFIDSEYNVTYKNKKNGKDINDADMIHIMNISEDGITGKSIKTYAQDTLKLAKYIQEFQINFFEGGGAIGGILSPKDGVEMDDEQAIAAKSKFTGATTQKTNSVVVLGTGLDYQKIGTDPEKSMMIQAQQAVIIDIAEFLNVPPSLLFDQNAKYSTTEQQQLDYLTNCILPLCEAIEAEVFKKLFTESEYDLYEIKFDTENLLRTDSTARADYFVKLFGIGGYTTNEIRQKLNQEFPVKGGNRAFVPVNLQPTDSLISEQTVVSDTSNQIDNKLKQDKSE